MRKRVVIFELISGQMGGVPKEYHISIRKAEQFLLEKQDALPFDLEFDFHTIDTFPVDAGRNVGVQLALDNNIDTTIWVDVDQEFPRDVFFRLLKSPYPVTSGIYYIKSGRPQAPYYPVMFQNGHDGNENFSLFKTIALFPKDEYFYADMVGMGCIRIDTNVFKALKKGPYFKYQLHPKDSAEPTAEWKHANDIQDVSEDVWFFKRLRKETDYKVVVDPRIQCAHIGKFIYDANMYDAFIRQMEERRETEPKLQEVWEKICRAEPIKTKS